MTGTVIVILAVGGAFLLIQAGFARASAMSIRAHCEAWVQACRTKQLSGMSRDAAVAFLERELDAEPKIAMLRRLGTIAPLLGVVLTAGSVVLGDSGRSLAALSSAGLGQDRTGPVADALAPLLAGVCVGAALAIINQALLGTLAFIERSMLRVAVRSVDDVDFVDDDNRIGLVTGQIEAAGSGLANAVQRLESAAQSVARDAGMLSETCAGTAEGLRGASVAFGEALGQTLGKINESASAISDGMSRCGEQMRLATASLEEISVQTNKSAAGMVARQANLAEQQQRLSAALEATARKFADAAEPLRDPAISAFQAALRKTIEGQEALVASHEHLLNSQRRASNATAESIQAAQQAAQQLGETINQLRSAGHSQLAADIDRLRAEVGKLDSVLGSAGQRTGPLIERMSFLTDRVGALSGALNEGEAGLRELRDSIGAIRSESTSFSMGLRSTTESLAAAVSSAVARIDEIKPSTPATGWLWRGGGRRQEEQGGT